jgi:hydroxypyruvate reductase
MLAETRRGDIVLALISGGGSAMLELLVGGVELEEMRALTRTLLLSGAPIEAVNTVRKTLSQVKAGGLARLAAPARVVSLILSDVVGDKISAVASGPTVLQYARPGEARAVLKRFVGWPDVPEQVRRALRRSVQAGSHVPRPRNILIGSNRQVVEAARRQAAEMEFAARTLTMRMRGEARDVGGRFGARLARIARGRLAAARPLCLLMGGETTVTVRGPGQGGRNQELALGAMLALEGVAGVAVMALATDGVDGPTDAAGAVVSGESAARARLLGFDPLAALEANDAYPALDALGALLRTGMTGTNLNDLVVGLIYSDG